MIKLVYKILPVYIRYVPDDSMKKFSGYSYGLYIKIKESHKNDSGLLEHELTHSRQFYLTLGLYGLLNRIAWFRYRFELSAYREQLKHNIARYKEKYTEHGWKWDAEQDVDAFTKFICDWYDLNVNQDKVEHDLLRGMK